MADPQRPHSSSSLSSSPALSLSAATPGYSGSCTGMPAELINLFNLIYILLITNLTLFHRYFYFVFQTAKRQYFRPKIGYFIQLDLEGHIINYVFCMSNWPFSIACPTVHSIQELDSMCYYIQNAFI